MEMLDSTVIIHSHRSLTIVHTAYTYMHATLTSHHPAVRPVGPTRKPSAWAPALAAWFVAARAAAACRQVGPFSQSGKDGCARS